MTLRTLNYGNYGIFLIMGNAGFCPSAVVPTHPGAKTSALAGPKFDDGNNRQWSVWLRQGNTMPRALFKIISQLHGSGYKL